MSIKNPDREYLDTKNDFPSGGKKKMIYDKKFSDEKEEEYKNNLNEERK